jgi:tetratricopeptide (TPR) repeat protein
MGLITDLFSPESSPDGKIVYNFVLSADIDDEFAFYDLDPYRQTLVVLGLASYRTENTSKQLETELKALKTRYPRALVHKVLVFGVPSEDAVEGSKHIIPILSVKVSGGERLERALVSISSDLLGELSVFSISKELGSFKSPALKELDLPVSARKSTDKARPYNSSLKDSHAAHNLRSPSESTPDLSRSASFTKTGSISIGLTDRAKSRQQGRTLKFMGDLYLLAGRLDDALKKFSEAASILKATFDHLWYASALDRIGVCLVLQSFLEVPAIIPLVALNAVQGSDHSNVHSPGHSRLPSSASLRGELNKSRSSSPVSGLGQHYRAFSASSSNLVNAAQPPLREFLPDLTDTVLRQFYRCQGHSEEVVPQVIFCETALRLLKLLVTLRVGGGWNRASLSSIVRGTAMTQNLTSQSPSAMEITKWFNQIYSTELFRLHVVAQCRIYSGLASAFASAGMPRKESFVMRELILNLHALVKSRDTHEDGIAAFKALDSGIPGGLPAMLDCICTAYSSGNVHSAGCGWQKLKISLIRSCAAICETIGDDSGIVHFCSLLISTSADMLPKEEQLLLFSKIHKAIDSAKSRSPSTVIAAPYWDCHILRDIRPHTNNASVPVRQVIKDTNAHTSSIFLYNPFKRDTLERDVSILVEGEPSDFLLKLQNPFEFEIHINTVELVTDGVTLKGTARNIYLPPSGIYDAVISVTPQSHGTLNVTGCIIQVAGCEAEEFHLLQNPVQLLEVKTKNFGVRSGEALHQQQHSREKRKLTLEVIAAQPLVALKHLDLEQGWIVLYEGEKKSLAIALTNYTNSLADTLQFSFADSTLEPLQTELATRDVSPIEAYEFEYFLYKRHSLRLLSDSETVLEPHSTKEFEVLITGKRGMSSATIIIDYGRRAEGGSDAWTRRVSIPVGVTIAGGIEMGGTDVIPFTSAMRSRIGGLSYNTEVRSDPHHEIVLVVLDLRNTSPQTLKTKLWSFMDDTQREKFAEVVHSISPGNVKRFLLPVRWKYLEREESHRRIPSLSNRQYVVDTSLSPEQQYQQRETFWFRHELLKLLDGSWETEDGARTGTTELRGMRLHRSVVNLLRYHPVQISFKLDGEGAAQTDVESTWTVATNTPVTLRVTIENTSNLALGGTLQISPLARYDSLETRDMLRNVIYEGELSQSVPRLEPGASTTFNLQHIVLARGDYMWTGHFDVETVDDKFRCSQLQPFYVRAVRAAVSK